MKIVVCGSMSSAVQMLDAEKELLQNNHEVVLPNSLSAVLRPNEVRQASDSERRVDFRPIHCLRIACLLNRQDIKSPVI